MKYGMNTIYKYVYMTLLVAAAVSCSYEMEEAVVSNAVFRLRLEEPSIATKVTLQNPLSLYASERLWKWEEGDMPSVIYMRDGKELIVPASSSGIDPADPDVMKVAAGETPSGASLKGAVIGNSKAFGKSCRGDEDIPSSMVYARATFSSIGDAVVLPDLTLKHQCSYLYIVPDTVDGEQMTSFTIEGQGLKGGSGKETVRLSFKDSDSGVYMSRWVAVSNNATDIAVNVTAGGKTFQMAVLPDTGKGRCNLYYVRNTSIGVEYK